MTDDATLLRRYLEKRSQPAFAALVERHVDLVYGVALRRLDGDAHAAADVTQAVFVLLARKAPTLADRPLLAGWLHTSATFVARETIRREQRRRRREQEAQRMQHALAPDSPATDWERLRPIIDDALTELDEHDREAVLGRFFSGRKFAEIGARLRVSDAAARMRVERALDQLRSALARRGITSTSAALSVALTQAAVAAPEGLAASAAAGVALAGGPAALGFWSIMSTPKIITGTAAALAILALGVGFFQYAELGRFDAALAQERTDRDAQLEQAARRVADLETRAQSTTAAAVVSATRTVASASGTSSPATLPARPLPADSPLPSPEAVARVAAALPLGSATHVAYVVDTSGSMRDPATESIRATVIEQLWAILVAHQNVQFIQIIDSDGRFILGGEGAWVTNSSVTRDAVQRALDSYQVFSNSDPVPGITRAMRDLPESANVTPVMSVVVLGDEFTEDENFFAARMEQLNPRDTAGRRRLSVNAVAFVSHLGGAVRRTPDSTVTKFSTAMRQAAAEHGGVFVEAP